MKKNIILTLISTILILPLLEAAAAPIVNPPNVPLETGTAATVKPNIMFILDDSGSMAWNYLGDEMGDNLCKIYSSGSNSIKYFNTDCVTPWETPFMAFDVNKIYYNPNTTYKPGIKHDGTSYGSKTLTTAMDNVYQTTTVTNLNNLQENYYCTKSSPSATELTNTNICRRNGINHTNNTFNYYTQGYPDTTYKYAVLGPMTLSYYTIIPTEYCDQNFVNCSTSSSSSTPNSASVRWCADQSTAMSTSLQTGTFPSNYSISSLRGKNKCQKNYDPSNYKYPRYGNFKRINLTSAEYTNFANWYTYYRTRMLAMKTSVGLAFQKLDSKTRVGFVTINPGSPVSSNKFLAVADFDAGQKESFYTKLYSQTPANSTPLREALSRVGRYFAGITNGINSGMTPDPMQYSCQQNFSILSTDGYWNGNGGVDLSGTAIGNTDNSNSGYSTRAVGAYDGGVSGASGTLSDVAMFYYKTDLRSAGALAADNVPISISDNNPSQHMVTYAISLGLNGFLSYTKDYLSGGNTDFENIKKGYLDWPLPVGDSPSAIDDLWHATVNGRGKYYSAQNTDDIVSGLTDAVNSLITVTGASAAAATSSPNITSQENSLFYVTYRTVKWDGEISATTIDPVSGSISATQKWSARDQLNTKVSTNTDTRNIYYVRNSNSTSSLIGFNSNNMNSSELAYFTNKCANSNLSQCPNLNNGQQTLIDNGNFLINYLRGQSQYDTNNTTNPLFRVRDYVLGDIVDSSPAYVSKPLYNWGDNYSTYASTNANRAPVLYVGANDGMVHAFDAITGNEKWAIIPAQMMSKMYKLADTAYSLNHQFYVDGVINSMDAQINGAWKTVVVTGMGAGGKGYIAIDVTDSNNPKVLWEICNTNVCSVTDSDIGYTYGNPIVTKRAFDGKWVVYLSAGYDNASGKGLIYEVDLANGSILRRLYTGTGSNINQSGVAKINAYVEKFNEDNTALYLYVGDLDGKVWKWDLSNSANTTATQMGQALDENGTPQPITTKIEIGKINGDTLLFIGTGQFLNTNDYGTTQTQSVYAFKDKNINYSNFRSNNTLVKQNITPGTITSTGGTNSVDLATKNGWWFDLTSQVGERVNIDPILALGVLNLATNVPGTSACTAGGNSWMYKIDFATGKAVDQVNAFISTKMPSGLIVGQVIVQLGIYGGLKNYVTDASGKVTVLAVPTGTLSGVTSGKKHFWREIYKK